MTIFRAPVSRLIRQAPPRTLLGAPPDQLRRRLPPIITSGAQGATAIVVRFSHDTPQLDAFQPVSPSVGSDTHVQSVAGVLPRSVTTTRARAQLADAAPAMAPTTSSSAPSDPSHGVRESS